MTQSDNASCGRVLLTGASGFMGRAAIKPLREASFEIHAVARRAIDAPADVKWHTADLLDDAATKQLIDEIAPSHLLHFAWYAEPGKYWMASENFAWLRSSRTLLQTFRDRGGRRAVVAGTCGEYEWKSASYSEVKTPLIPATIYGACKNNLQNDLAALARDSGLSSAWGRIFFPYGPHEQPARLVPSVICALLQGNPALCTPGEQVRDFIHVHDVAGAFVALLASTVEGAVNIASGRGVAVKDIALRIGERLGRTDLVRLGARAAPQGEPPIMIADICRLQEEVGWRSVINLEDGLDDSIEWWKNELARQSNSMSAAV
jgi:nucleoside-diphosphate-sugar epimerase